MNMFYIVGIVVFMIIDLLICIFFGNGIFSFRSYFWIFHFSTTLIFLWLEKFFKEKEGYEVFILLFPSIGYFMLLIEYLTRFKVRFDKTLENSESYEKYLEDKEKEIVVQSSVDLNFIGAYDILAVGSPEEKKDFLIEFETFNVKFKIDVLKKALLDKDTNVIHYAATEINKIDEKFQKNIKKYKKEENMEKLCEIYFNYLLSGLLEDEILKFYQNITLKLLKEKSKETLKNVYMRLVIYKNMKNHSKIKKIIKELLYKETLPEYIFDFIKEYYYEENEIEKYKEVERWQKSV